MLSNRIPIGFRGVRPIEAREGHAFPSTPCLSQPRGELKGKAAGHGTMQRVDNFLKKCDSSLTVQSLSAAEETADQRSCICIVHERRTTQ